MPEKPLTEKLDPKPLVTRLTEKTQAGKIEWQPMADADSFVATVGGNTFKMWLTPEEGWDPVHNEPETVLLPAVALLNKKNQAIWTIGSGDVEGGLWNLFKLVQRVGHKLDERMADAIAELEKL